MSDALTTTFALSVITATTGNATKRIIANAHSQPVKDPKHTLAIGAGHLEHVRVDGLTGFAALLARVSGKQALVHGVPKGSTPGNLFTLVTAEKFTAAPGTIARTLECIDYPPGVRLVMADYDPDPRAPTPLGSAADLITHLAAIWPVVTDVGWLATTSTSSAIKDKQTRAWVRPPDGMHVYCLVTGDVARFRDLLRVKLWLAGSGFCKLATPNSHTGIASILERALIDLTVLSPERLDFVAGAQIAKRAPFYQDRPAPIIHPGVVLDLDALPDVTPEEREEYLQRVTEARARVQLEQQAHIRTHIRAAQPDLPDADVDEEATRRLERAERGELDPGQPLYFSSGAVCTAGTVHKSLDGKRLRDPLEPDYLPSQAVFHWRDGDWRIVSWAHGVKKVYHLERPTPEPPDVEEPKTENPDEGSQVLAQHGSYQETPNGLVWLKDTHNGTVRVPLTNFTARIVADLEQDDGAETRRVWDIEATHGGTKCFTIAAEQFAGMTWVPAHLGATAMVMPGITLKDHARAAIQMLSRQVKHRTVYTHTGWRKVRDQWVYLHAGGAIGQVGQTTEIEVALPDELQRYTLPEPGDQAVVQRAITTSLRLLDVAPSDVTIPLYAGIWLAVLGEAALSLCITGQTGIGKSAFAALVQQHFGAGMDAHHLPGNWSSSANALEGLAFTAKDAVLVIDELTPTDSIQAQALYRTAERLLRAQANRSGRQRMRADTTLRPAKPPRGLIVATGEDIPQGHSLRARMIIVEIAPDAIDFAALTQCQADAATSAYAQALAGYVQWLAPRYGEVQRGLPQKLAQLRQEALQSGNHRRTPENTARLALGWRTFLQFAQESGALTEKDVHDAWKQGWTALGSVAQSQARYLEQAEPTRRFLGLLSNAIASGKAHLAASSGDEPAHPQAWGWRVERRQRPAAAYEDRAIETWKPYGVRVGWIDEGIVYLLPDAAYATAQQLGKEVGEPLTVSPATLHRRLKERGLLILPDASRETVLLRKVLEGQRRYVLSLTAENMSLLSTEKVLTSLSQQPAQPAHLINEYQQEDNGQVSQRDWAGDGKKKTANLPTKTLLKDNELSTNGQVGQEVGTGDGETFPPDVESTHHVADEGHSWAGHEKNLPTKPAHAPEEPEGTDELF